MNNNINYDKVDELKNSLLKLNKYYINIGCHINELKQVAYPESSILPCSKILILSAIVLLLTISYQLNYFGLLANYLLGVRCIIPNNYFVWEASRPITNCNFCANTSQPIYLYNATKEQFAPLAYSSLPIVIRGAFLHWPALHKFSLQFFRDLYNQTEGAYSSVDEECQFLHFKSDFTTIRDVFSMSEKRIQNSPTEKSWYVGWGNCHPVVLEEMRKYYPKPHFLPDDCEIPYKEYVFMGYDDGATMHLDFINRLMWQAQLKGSKTWRLIPPPECQDICRSFSFSVKPGDAVLVDTRIWYHGTTITPGEFSLSVQSEYGMLIVHGISENVGQNDKASLKLK